MNPQVKDVERRAVTLKWFPPAKDGGSPVTGYIIEYRVSGQFGWDVTNHGEPIMDQRYTVRNLKDGESYEFRIAAVNKAGKGAFAPVDMLVAVKEPVGKYLYFGLKLTFSYNYSKYLAVPHPMSFVTSKRIFS